jgi:hypothetical protein
VTQVGAASNKQTCHACSSAQLHTMTVSVTTNDTELSIDSQQCSVDSRCALTPLPLHCSLSHTQLHMQWQCNQPLLCRARSSIKHVACLLPSSPQVLRLHIPCTCFLAEPSMTSMQQLLPNTTAEVAVLHNASPEPLRQKMCDVGTNAAVAVLLATCIMWPYGCLLAPVQQQQQCHNVR